MVFDCINRRDLFSPGRFTTLVSELMAEPGPAPLSEQEQLHANIAQYFESIESSYPILQEMPWEMLVEEAIKLGIPTEGRAKLDIARDIFLRQPAIGQEA